MDAIELLNQVEALCGAVHDSADEGDLSDTSLDYQDHIKAQFAEIIEELVKNS